MQAFRTTILIASLGALVGCASWEKSSIATYDYDKSPICPKTHGWLPWADDRCNPPPPPPRNLAAELEAAQKQNGALSRRVSDLEQQLADRDRQIAALRDGAGDSAKLASQLSSTQSALMQSQQRAGNLERELAASAALAAGLQSGAADKDKQITELERQLAERDTELAGLRGELSAEMAKLKEAQRGLIRALRPQIEKGDITVDLNNERLLINLASGYLFGSGEAELKPAGADALRQVGAVLKDFPEYNVAVDGHTDNVPIQGALKKRFPTNMVLSEFRATNAAKALTDGGLGAAMTHGYADTKPIEPNTTASGRAKNRRVEIRVTK